jgi:hypothetical protein
MQPAAVNGDLQDDDDDSYWNQYDQYAGQGTSENAEAPKEITQDSSGYYDQYDNIETAIGDRDYSDDSGNRGPRGIGSHIPREDGNEIKDIGLDDYIRNAVSNMWTLAARCNMSKARFEEIISEGLN